VSVPVLVLVGALGGLGAMCRFLLDSAVSARVAGAFPFGTLAVNLTGAFLLGVFLGAALEGNAYRELGTGLVGGYTTFSTWALESHRLGEDGEVRLGGANFVLSLVAGVTAAWLGRQLGGAL
jgi:fluoride exporter